MPTQRLPQCSSCRRVLQGAWEALSTRGLHQVCCRRHGLLHCAWRRPPLSDGGLHQVCYRQYWPLQGTRRRQAMPVRRLPHCSSCRRVLQGAREAMPAAGLRQASSSPVDALPSVSTSHTAVAGGRCGCEFTFSHGDVGLPETTRGLCGDSADGGERLSGLPSLGQLPKK